MRVGDFRFQVPLEILTSLHPELRLGQRKEKRNRVWRGRGARSTGCPDELP